MRLTKNDIRRIIRHYVFGFAYLSKLMMPIIFGLMLSSFVLSTITIIKYETMIPSNKKTCVVEYVVLKEPIAQHITEPKEIVIESSAKTTPSPSPSPKFVTKTMYTNSKVNLREQPSTESNIVDTINFGSKVTVTNTIDNWYEIKYDGSTCFIRNDLLCNDFPATKVSSTAYYDKYNRRSASGRPLVMNHSIAGKIEWLGKKVNIYTCNKDGSIGSCIGTYRFDDTGYGQATGIGSSEILEGVTIGTIENGTCIDIYMDTEEQCYAYGRKNVYIQFVN